MRWRQRAVERFVRSTVAVGLSCIRSKTQVTIMADDKTKTKEDRKLVSAGETYEVADFAKKYGVPPSEAATIIKRYGPSRKKLDAYMASRQA